MMKTWLLLLLTMLAINHNLALAFVLALGGVSKMPMARYGRVLFGAHDISVKLPGGEVRTVAVEEGDSILEALEAHDIDAPHSCRTGLCTECAAMVTAKLENVMLDAAVLDPAVSAMGFVLTCSATVEGDGVELELGAGDKMYEAQYGEFRKGHEEAQVTKPGQWSLPLPDVGGA